jgi:TolB-like protein/Tfp pilus assembly protein PilF
VLPFVNLGAGGEEDYFSDSLTEELIHALARLPGLRVIARSSAFQFKDSRDDGRSIGRRLQVGYVLEGSTRLSGARLRITAQLVEVETGWLLWSEKFERARDTLFTVQDEIVASITDALKIRLTAEQSKLLFNTAAINADSYSEYLKGRYFWNQRTPQALSVSVRCYEKALALDPACVPAYSGLADTYMVMALNDQEPRSALMLKARSAARHAVELRPEWPDTLVSLGTVKSIFDWDWEGGARGFESALRLTPGSANVHYLFAILNLQPRALWEEALAHMEAAIQLDPVSPVLQRDLGIIHFMRRRWDQADGCFSTAESLAPAFRGTLYWKARVFIERNRPHEAMRVLEQRRMMGDANTRVTATMAYAAACAGDLAAATRIRDELLNKIRSERVPPLDMAFVYLGLADWDAALVWLKTACEERAATLYQFGVDPIYDPIRSDPRSEGIRLAMGLPA